MIRLLLTLLGILSALNVGARHYDLTARRISTADGLPSNTVIRMWQDEEGYLWFETINGTCRFDGYEMTQATTIRPPDSIRNALHTREANWVVEGQGRLSRHGRDGSISSWQLISPEIIKYTRNDHFHVADVDERTEAISTYGNGLYLYDKPTGELTQIQKGDRHGVLNDNYLTGLFVDRTGCIWVIEDYLGVNCLRLNTLRYTPLWVVPDAQIQDVNYIRCIAPFGNEQLLVANQTSDTYLYNTKTNRFSFRQNDGVRVYMALIDYNGHEWIGTRGNGLWCDGRQIDGLPSRHIFNIRESSVGHIIVSMLEGGVAIFKKSSTVLRMTGKNVHDAWMDREGQLWVAAEDGLFLLNTHGVVTDSLSGYFVCMLVNDDGTIWGGTTNRGLFQLASNNGRLETKSYTKRNGLVSDCIYSLTSDHRGRVWMGTEEGLSMIDAQRKNITNYKIAESSLSNVFCERAAVCLPDGRLLFGTHQGIISVMPSDETVPMKARTSITEFLANGIPTEERELPYTQNVLTFRFSNFMYAYQQNVIFKYRLDGIDQDWSPATIDHSVTYRSLPPGRYTFIVCSSSGGDVWGDETTISFTISQPWWNTGWAWLMYILFTGTLIVSASMVIRRIMRLRQTLDVERKVSAFKMEFYNRVERELRNPVNVLQGAAENVQLSGTSKTTVQSLRRGSRRMLKLMDMIQQFHRLNDVEMQVKAEQNAMNEEAEKRFLDIRNAIYAEEQEFLELAPPPINVQTILIVEDDEDNLTHLTDTLNSYFRVVACPLMSECEALVQREQPALLLMDITSDEKAGRELTKRLKETNPAIPVIHLSSFSDDAHQLRSLRCGSADYIVKPFSSKILLERVRKSIGSVPVVASSENTIVTEVLTEVKDKKFLDQFNAILSQHIANENFSVELFAELMHLGRTQFYKKVKMLTGETPVQHLHRARLDFAARLLKESQMTVDEVMARAGFNSPTYFYNSFKKQFGMSPKDYRQKV